MHGADDDDEEDARANALTDEARRLCDAGDRAGLAAFVCSARGFQFAQQGFQPRSLLAFAVRAAIRHDRWELLDDVLAHYLLYPSRTLLVLLDLAQPTRETIDAQWVNGMCRLVQQHLPPPLREDAQRIAQIAANAGIWSVWFALAAMPRNALRTYLNGQHRYSDAFWGPWLLAFSHDEALLWAQAQRLTGPWPGWIDAERRAREARRAAVMQGAHPRLGAASPLHLLTDETLRYIVERSRDE
jgi:hypothetical protein